MFLRVPNQQYIIYLALLKMKLLRIIMLLHVKMNQIMLESLV